MLPEPPFPITATFGTPTKVTFSTFLTPGVIDEKNWSVRWQNFRYKILIAEVVPAYRNRILHLTLNLAGGQIQPGRDIVDYTPPVFDLTSRIGNLPAPGFLDFPLHW